MKADDWQAFIVRAVGESANGNPISLQLIAQNLEMCDSAKQVLRDRGYGWTGVDLLETAKMVPMCAVPEPVYASLEVTMPPHIVEYRTVIDQDIVELDAAINALLADGWQPYMDQHARGPMVWQVMVKCATSGTGGAT